MYFSIQDGSNFWQCGMWVKGIHNATKYPSESEADAVKATRNLHNGTVVPNNGAWRDQRQKDTMKPAPLINESVVV